MFNIEKYKSYWNEAASHKEFTHPINFKKFQKIIDKDAFILDYGCGYGRSLQQLFEKGYKNSCGIDYSSKMIERGKLQYPHLKLSVNNNFKIPFKKNIFDAVLLFSVLTCTPDSDQQAEIIKEIYRTLKPNGIIYISDYLLQQDERNLERYQKYKDQHGCYGIFSIEKNILMRHHSEDYIKNLTENFKKSSYTKINIITMNNNKAMAFQYLGKKLTY